ncbi:hypothetical protein [Cupriavidus sp. CP313]
MSSVDLELLWPGGRPRLTLGAAAQSDADVSAEVAPPLADLRTAEHLDARVAEVAQQLVAGRRVLAELKEAA